MFKQFTVLAAIAAVALSACSAAEAELDGDLEVGGTDPANWSVEVKRAAGKAVISIVGEPSFEGSLPDRSRGEDGVVLMTSKTASGDFVMNFTHKECYDGLAEEPRPWTVTVDWNSEVLKGCAFPLPTPTPAPAAG